MLDASDGPCLLILIARHAHRVSSLKMRDMGKNPFEDAPSPSATERSKKKLRYKHVQEKQ